MSRKPLRANKFVVTSYVLVIIALTSFLTPQYTPILTALSSIIMLIGILSASKGRHKVMLASLLLISLLSSLVALVLIHYLVTSGVLTYLIIFLQISFITTIPLYLILVTYGVKHVSKSYVLLASSLMILGSLLIPFNVNAKALSYLSEKASSLIELYVNTGLGLYLSFSAPLPLSITLLGALIAILTLIKRFRELLS